MAWMNAMGRCFGCKKLFAFSPSKVPSFKGEPICETCIKVVNAKRKTAGLPEWPVLPGAYEPDEVA